MAGPMTTMFGKAYDTVGSADRNLILQTRGDLKVKWGNKYIDLIKNGKINVDVDLLKKIDSKDSIHKDGLYLIEKENTPEVWLSIGGSVVNLLGEVGTTYVSFLAPQDVTSDQKLMALTNAGLYYETLDKAKKATIKQGIVYIIDEQQFYTVKDGEYSKYTQQVGIPDPLVLGQLTINGTTGKISGTNSLSFDLENDNYISFDTNRINLIKETVVYNNFQSNNYIVNKDGYRLYIDSKGISTLEIDKVIIRQLLVYEEIIDVTYSELQRLIMDSKLIPGKKYKIIDFQNEWEVTREVQYEDETIYDSNNEPIGGKAKNVWPIVVQAKTNNILYPNFYFYDNDNWKGEYDVNFYHLIREESVEESIEGQTKTTIYNIFSKGRITKLVDEKNNQANYDFKHRLFKYSSASNDQNYWYYTFNFDNPKFQSDNTKYYKYENTHIHADASQYKDKITNNIIYLPVPVLEDIEITEDDKQKKIKKIVPQNNYIIFPNCSTIYPHDNKILDSLGKYVITNNFYNNTFIGLYNTSGQETQFTLDFHDNTFQKVHNCILDTPMQYNIFDYNLVNVAFECISMSNNHITGIIYTNSTRDAYPIQAKNFNNNIINNINMSAIKCANHDITNNVIYNINGCDIVNSTLTNVIMKDIIGDRQYEMDPTDDIKP